MATTNVNIKVASSAAISKGRSLESTLGSSVSAISKIQENPPPSINAIAKQVKLQTFIGGNVASPETIVEQYFIRPNFKGLMKCSGGQNTIWYLPLNTTYAIKFYAPDQYNSQFYNYVYAVPTKKDETYVTGFKDFTTGVSQAWIDAFKQYASSLPVNIKPSTSTEIPLNSATRSFSAAETATQEKIFTFNFQGSLSGTIGKSSSFSFKFVFYPGTSPVKPPIVKNPTVSTIN